MAAAPPGYAPGLGSNPSAQYSAAIRKYYNQLGSGAANTGTSVQDANNLFNPQDRTPTPPNTDADPNLHFTTTPNYQSLITGDGGYQLGKMGIDAADLAAAGQRGLTARHLIEQFGDVPDFARLFGGGMDFINSDIDPLTRSLASQNTAAGTSTLGQLGYQHGQNLSNLGALMASRGLLNSGQNALLQTGEGRDYSGALNSAQSQLFDALSKAQQDYLSTYTTGQQSMAQLASDSANRLQQSNQFDPVDVSATLDRGFTSNGGSVYKDANGNYWTADGKAVARGSLTAVSATPTPPPPGPSAPSPPVAPYAPGNIVRGGAVAQ